MTKQRYASIRIVKQKDGVTVSGIRRSARGTKFYANAVNKKGKVSTKKELKSLTALAIAELMGDD